ncbi:uncharacterized protein [Primulina huaijiensis]|uniref:uncharacterized protein n=1 Tax=Primulina huaijiensis TaxID=1492673 RepID=UPI003CC7992E
MPTVILFEYNGEWEINEDNIFKWRSWPSGKWAAIPLDSDICSMEYIKSEIYRIMNLGGTEKLKLSYLPDVKHCNIRPIYIEDDNDLKAYLYFGCAKERPVLHVEFELSVVSLDIVESENIMSPDLNLTHLDDEYVDDEINMYDHYFDRTFVSNDHCTSNDVLEDINTSTENMQENDVRSTENDVEDINAVHVDDNDVNIHHISVAHDTETHVQADTYSFIDGSILFIGQRFSSKTEVKKVLSKIALNSSFEFETVKSSRNIYSVRCVNKGCSWRIWTSKHENSTDFVIRTYCNTHNCDLTGMRKRHRQASSSIVCDMLVENFGGQQKTPQPKSIMTMMRNKGVDITYYKALKGKQLAHDIFRGDPERSFDLLPSYLKMVERVNPGSIIDLVVDEHNRFNRFCIKGLILVGDIKFMSWAVLSSMFEVLQIVILWIWNRRDVPVENLILTRFHVLMQLQRVTFVMLIFIPCAQSIILL